MSDVRVERGDARSPSAATPRVRERAREAAGLMAFSASVSVGLALLLVLLVGVLG